MSDSDELVRGDERSAGCVQRHYEAPVLEPIGNVREILAGTLAGSPDGGDPPSTFEV
jgi:hypothetical protein